MPQAIRIVDRIQDQQDFSGTPTDGLFVVYNATLGKFVQPTSFSHNNTDGSISLSTTITKYNSVATAGWGVPAVYGQARSTAQTGAVASVASYTVGAADGSFHVSANVNVTTYSSGTFTVTVTYTDEGNTSRTTTFNFSNTTGTLGTSIAAAGPFQGLPLHIRAKASTSITIATTGTFTSLTYNVEGNIIQIA